MGRNRSLHEISALQTATARAGCRSRGREGTMRARWLHDTTGRDDIVLRCIYEILAMEVTQSDVDERAHTILTAPPRAVDRGRSASSSRWTRSGTPTSSPASSPPPPARPGWAVCLGLETARGCCCSVLHRPRARAPGIVFVLLAMSSFYLSRSRSRRIFYVQGSFNHPRCCCCCDVFFCFFWPLPLPLLVLLGYPR